MDSGGLSDREGTTGDLGSAGAEVGAGVGTGGWSYPKEQLELVRARTRFFFEDASHAQWSSRSALAGAVGTLHGAALKLARQFRSVQTLDSDNSDDNDDDDDVGPLLVCRAELVIKAATSPTSTSPPGAISTGQCIKSTSLWCLC